MRSSQRAFDLILQFETGGQANYVPHAVWPGGLSGVTWGIGFDAGYETPEQITADWSQYLDRFGAKRLAAVAGIRGPAAEAAAANIADIIVPWREAVAVFRDLNVPRYEGLVPQLAPHADELPPDCFGALLSLVFNRGPGIDDSPKDPEHRRREMRQLHDCAAARWWAAVPDLIRSMQRLWSNGLRDRRAQEALLFEYGLRAWPNPPRGAVMSALPAQPSPPASAQSPQLDAAVDQAHDTLQNAGTAA